jgi:hypothetical protein
MAKLGMCVFAIAEQNSKERFDLIGTTESLYHIPFGVSLR